MKIKKKGFICWLFVFIILLLHCGTHRSYKEADLKYIKIENAETEYYAFKKEGAWAIINDKYYYALLSFYPYEEYEKVCNFVQSNEICIGVVSDFRYKLIRFDSDCSHVISISSKTEDSPFTLDRYNNCAKKNLIGNIIIIAVYILISLVHVVVTYLLGERNLRKKWRKRKKKRKLQKKFGKK